VYFTTLPFLRWSLSCVSGCSSSRTVLCTRPSTVPTFLFSRIQIKIRSGDSSCLLSILTFINMKISIFNQPQYFPIYCIFVHNRTLEILCFCDRWATERSCAEDGYASFQPVVSRPESLPILTACTANKLASWDLIVNMLNANNFCIYHLYNLFLFK